MYVTKKQVCSISLLTWRRSNSLASAGFHPISEMYTIPTSHCAVNFRSSRHSIHSPSTVSNGLSGDAARFDPCNGRQSVSIRGHKSPVQDRKNSVVHLVLRSFSFNYTTPPTPTPSVKPTSVDNPLDQSARQSEVFERTRSIYPLSMSNVAFTTPSPKTPTFTIPTTNSLRRAKMDTLRKKLGPGVPVELVFRENGAQRSPCDSQDAATTRDATHTRCESNNHPLPPRQRNTLKRSTTSKLKAKHPRSLNDRIIDVPPPSGSVADIGSVKGRLPFIQEIPLEHLPGHKEVVIKLPTANQPVHTRCSTGDSQLSCRSSHGLSSYENWTYNSGANTVSKRSPSYRKPPPPIGED